MAIAATEAAYAEMWAQDAAAMYGYAASSSAATALTPFTEPPPTTNAGGQSDQAAGVAHDRRHLNRWTYSDNPVRAGADRVATAANPCDSRIFGLVYLVGVHLSGVVGTHRIQ